MDFLPYSQEYMLIVSVMGGMLLGFVWDIYRLIRHYLLLGNKGTFIGDVVYWVISAKFSIFIINDISSGNVRLFIILGFLSGALLYFLGISKYVLKVFISIVDFFVSMIKKFLSYIVYPIKFIFEKIKSILYPFRILIEKEKNKVKRKYKFFKFRIKKVFKNKKMIYNNKKNVKKRKRKANTKGLKP